MLKKLIIISVTIVALVAGSLFGAKTWVKSLLPEKAHFMAIKKTQVKDLPYITKNVPAYRGKILAVVKAELKQKPQVYQRTLIVMHSILAFM